MTSLRFNSMHERLRVQTRALHGDVERAIDLEARLTSLASYCQMLRTLWRLHASYEAAFTAQPWSTFYVDFAARCRSNLLLADLAALGVLDVSHLQHRPRIDGLYEALGCLYVLEGPTLCGQAVIQRAHARLGITPGRGASFFWGYGERNGDMWMELVRAINMIPVTVENADAIEAGARRTFQAFLDEFRKTVAPGSRADAAGAPIYSGTEAFLDIEADEARPAKISP